jgi:hypothetical protein
MYDISGIKEQFKRVIAYSQGIADPQVDYLFRTWEANKERFIERFGGLIYEWPEPVEFTLDPVEKKKRALDFVECVSNTFDNEELADFLDLNLDTFFDNKVSNSGGKKIPEGMKLIKAFKFFENNKQALRDMQDIASQMIQENCVKGTLCFSVHPLDFLSSSENTYNWRSCHALDGEYRAGNLSYMVDDCTFMVYIKGANSASLPGFPPDLTWNSKKWRMLIHAGESDQIMFAGRQYPFSSKSGIDMVLKMYNNLMPNDFCPFGGGKSKYREWRADYVDSYVPFDAVNLDWTNSLEERYIVIKKRLVPLEKMVKQGPGALNYNDVLFSTCYKYPYYAILNPDGWHSVEWLQEHPILIGGEVPCLLCHNELIRNAETMRCDDCEVEFGYEENDNYGHCECCGRRIHYDDAYYVGDDYVCDHCFNNECFVCDNCGEVYYNTEKHCIEVEEDEVEYVCSHCHMNYIDKGDY